VAVEQYTFTHKQYTERQRKTNKTPNNPPPKKNKDTEQHKNVIGKCGPCPVLASYTLAFALQMRKKYGKPSVRVAEQFEYI
jgi:hypothetical protein